MPAAKTPATKKPETPPAPREPMTLQGLFSRYNVHGMLSQYEQALKGEGNTKGLLKIIEEYGGTETANIAKLYAGLAYAKTDKVDEAIKMLEDFSVQDDDMVSPAAIAALGNLYVKKGDNEKGIKTLIKAAEEADNDAVSPVFLLQAGEVYESLGQNDKALELYNKIKKQYFRSPLSQEIDMYIERATK
jgi:tetratricopeptide (TPR) repeat protein